MRGIESITVWLLRLSGGIICLSAIAIFLPNAWMASIHQRLGLGDMPNGVIVEYMARTLSAMYFAHGLIVLQVSSQVKRFWPMVGFLGCINVLLGSLFFWIDQTCRMPNYWTWMEGPPIAAMGLLLMALWSKGRGSEDISAR